MSTERHDALWEQWESRLRPRPAVPEPARSIGEQAMSTDLPEINRIMELAESLCRSYEAMSIPTGQLWRSITQDQFVSARQSMREAVANQLHAALAAQAEAHAVQMKKANAQAEHFEREWYLRGDEIDALRAERDAAELMSLALRAQVEALRVDAERYRWLRDNRVSENDDGEKCVYFWCDFEHYDNVDAAIDAARSKE